MTTPGTVPPSLYKSPHAARSIREGYAALLREWPVPYRHHHIPTSQGDTFAVECGSEDGPPLLLIHGSVSNAAAWMGDVPLWAPHFHIYAVDVIGEAGFSAPCRPPLKSDAYARWLDDVMDGLGLEAASLAGISLGGWLALDFAIRRPSRVSNLVVIVPGGVGPQRNILYWAVPLSLLGRWGRSRVHHLLLGPPPAETTDTIRRFSELWEAISQQFRPRYDKLPIFSDAQLTGLPMPVMAVVAGKDVMLAPGPMRRRLEAHVPDLEMHYLPDARHYPGSQAERVLEFLRRRSQPDAGAARA